MGQIVAKTAYLQARFLEPFVPSMARRGRLQPGSFADITIFDPDEVEGRADTIPGRTASRPKGSCTSS
jgi:dihydroorotase-like cyclic amidohydrolase